VTQYFLIKSLGPVNTFQKFRKKDWQTGSKVVYVSGTHDVATPLFSHIGTYAFMGTYGWWAHLTKLWRSALSLLVFALPKVSVAILMGELVSILIL
jgi:hypothetical protein